MDPDRSFERIYRRHRREVYGSVLRDVRDPDEAEDVTQVAFLNAYRAMRRGDRPEKPKAWLITIARNVVRRRARQRAERPQEVELDAELLVTLEDEEGSASEDICAALGELTDAQREAILLREIQGRTYAEIAEALALSIPAVEALLFRARRALAEELTLVDREPVVRRHRDRGLLALPGLSKLGSFGFSLGRVGIACVVGCAVIAGVPVGERVASGEPPASSVHTQVRQALLPVATTTPLRPAPVEKKKPAKRRPQRTRQADADSPTATTQADAGQGDSTTLPVQVPALPLPSVQVPEVTQPDLGVQLPPPPDLLDPPPLPSLTS